MLKLNVSLFSEFEEIHCDCAFNSQKGKKLGSLKTAQRITEEVLCMLLLSSCVRKRFDLWLRSKLQNSSQHGQMIWLKVDLLLHVHKPVRLEQDQMPSTKSRPRSWTAWTKINKGVLEEDRIERRDCSWEDCLSVFAGSLCSSWL